MAKKVHSKFQSLKDLIEETERSVFHRYFPEDEGKLYQELSNHEIKLNELRNQKVLRPDQMAVILPSSKKTSSKNFDPTVIQILMRNLSGMKKPTTGWNKEPKRNDYSVEANFVRLIRGRNDMSHLPTIAITEKRYKKLYKYLKKPLKDLGRTSEQLQRVMPNPIRFKYIQAVPGFAFRESELKELHDEFENLKNTPGKLAVGVSAISGTGKTELVRKFFDSNQKEYDYAIIWINAADIDESFFSLAKVFNIAIKDESDNNKEIDTIIYELHQHLRDEKIFVVFDNFEVPEREEDLIEKLVKYIPQGKYIHCVITSQTELIDSQRFSKLRLEPWELDDAVAYVENSLNCSHKDKISEIVKYVDCNTFAINQFIGYIKDTRTPIEDYLQLLKNQHQTPQSKVYTSISVTIDRIERNHQEALRLLQLMTFLNGKEMKRGLFICNGGYKKDDQASLIKSADINESLNILQKLCLINIIEENDSSLDDTFTVHTLVQQYLRIYPRLNQSEDTMFSKVMLFLLDGTADKHLDDMRSSDFVFYRYSYKQLMYIYNSFPKFKEKYIAICSGQFVKVMNIFHMQGRYKFLIGLLYEIKDMGNVKMQIVHQIESCIGCSFYYWRDFEKSLRILSDVKVKQKELLGEKHVDTLNSSLVYLRCLNSSSSKINKDSTQYQYIYNLHQDALGDSNPQTLISRCLFVMRSSQSEATLISILEAQEMYYGGPHHPEVFATKHNLIIKMPNTNAKLKIEYLESLLKDAKVLFGDQHVKTALVHHNLAVFLYRDLKYESALEHAIAAFRIGENIYDENHKELKASKKLVSDAQGMVDNDRDDISIVGVKLKVLALLSLVMLILFILYWFTDFQQKFTLHLPYFCEFGSFD